MVLRPSSSSGFPGVLGNLQTSSPSLCGRGGEPERQGTRSCQVLGDGPLCCSWDNSLRLSHWGPERCPMGFPTQPICCQLPGTRAGDVAEPLWSPDLCTWVKKDKAWTGVSPPEDKGDPDGQGEVWNAWGSPGPRKPRMKREPRGHKLG